MLATLSDYLFLLSMWKLNKSLINQLIPHHIHIWHNDRSKRMHFTLVEINSLARHKPRKGYSHHVYLI